MENSLSSVSPSRADHSAQLSETRQRPFRREDFTSRGNHATAGQPIAINGWTFNETERSARFFFFLSFLSYRIYEDASAKIASENLSSRTIATFAPFSHPPQEN